MTEGDFRPLFLCPVYPTFNVSEVTMGVTHWKDKRAAGSRQLRYGIVILGKGLALA